MKKQLRVLVIRNAYQQDAGGAEQYALNLAVALKKLGHQPILVTKITEIHGKAKASGIKCIKGPWHEAQGWDRWYYLRFPAFTLWYIYAILRYRINIVHPMSRDDFIFATRAAQLLGKPVIWTDHADLKYIMNAVDHFNPRMRNWVVGASKHAKLITCSSKNEKNEISEVAPELNEKLLVVHNGVFAPDNIRPAEKTNKYIVGTNARLVPAKGIGELIESFAMLDRKDTDLWLLGGFSGNKQRYQALAKKLGVDKQVSFLGYVPTPDDYVASMDVFVHASYHEAFSLAIIEAAMLGRPIVATGVGGTPEIIDSKCGILIKPKNSEEITNAVSALLKNKAQREKLGEAAKRKAVRDFDFQKIVESKILPLYS